MEKKDAFHVIKPLNRAGRSGGGEPQANLSGEERKEEREREREGRE